MKTLTVQIPGHEYDIHIGSGILQSQLPEAVQKFGPELIVAVTNTTLQAQYPFHIRQCLTSLNLPVETCIVPDGEYYKTMETLNRIYDFLLEKQANRKTLLIAFGGGVVGDMTGFAAATFMRGIPYIQVPTTLLSQVDSSIGGKTSVNHPLGKNTIGAFKQPVFVCIELEFLKSLPPRELKAGYFELLKHGIIHNAALFNFLQNHPCLLEDRDLDVLEQAIEASCLVKTRVVQHDEKETGVRATLNFGHTLGHLIETHTGYSAYLHGEAVGVGMVFATFVSRELQFLSESSFQQIVSSLKTHITPVRMPPLDFVCFQELILHDKKSSRHSVDFILIRRIGESFIHKNMTPEMLWPLFKKFICLHSWACEINSE